MLECPPTSDGRLLQRMRHLHAALIVGISSVAALTEAQALSFGRVRSAVVLGQPLSIAIPIVLQPGEDEVLEECVRADVLHGDTALPPNVIRTRLTRGSDDLTRVVRVSTTTGIDEPVVTVTVTAGCPPRLSRSFTLLADPPATLAQTAPSAADRAGAPPAPSSTTPGTSPALIAAGSTRPPDERPARREPPVRRAPSASPAGETAAPTIPPPAALPSAEGRRAPPTSARTRTAESAERPRLQLESGSVSAGASGSPVAVPDPAASAALANAAAAQATAAEAQTRVKSLESEVERLKGTTKEQAESIAQLRSKLAQNQGPASEWTQWLPWIAGLAALSTALALWLAYRVRKLAQENQRNAWWARENQSSLLQSRASEADEAPEASVRPPVSRIPMPPAGDQPNRTFVPSTVNVSPETIPAPVAPPAQVALSRQAARSSSVQSDMQVDTHRAVTVDEQIDLEQQADFFIALGHDDAAIDLLLAHLRSTGGAAPIPYLKLLEMYKRRGDRDDYEVIRRRFNQRFNSVAPDWDDYGQAGRPLVEYPKQVALLQAVWPNPLDTMAELEAMAFGRGSEKELFDLPAYQDVLFLYQLARQLHEDSSQGKGTGVDVLLPIGGETGPAPLMTPLESSSVNSTIMGSLDLDVSSQAGNLSPAMQAMQAMPQIDLDLPPRAKSKL
jgi:pilus assembly protein FimV